MFQFKWFRKSGLRKILINNFSLILVGYIMGNSDNYNVVAKFLHWIIALLIIINYILGLTLDNTYWYDIHKQTGLTIFFLVLLRIVWRLTSKYPNKLESISDSEQLAARIGQIALYILMLAIPISGIIMTQIHGRPLSIWGIVTVPILIGSQTQSAKQLISELHLWLAHMIIFIAFVHAAIALAHHYILRDRLLSRMLPGCYSKK